MARASLRGDAQPPGPFRPEFWRSPLRGPWLTSVLGLVLLAGITVLRHRPAVLRRLQPRPAGSTTRRPARGCSASTCSPGPPIRSGCTGSTRACTSPSGWCWSRCCWPSCGRCCRSCSSGRRCARPRTRWSGCRCCCWSAAAVFEFVTGILNIQLLVRLPRSPSTPLHFYGAWVFIAAFVVHVALKMPADDQRAARAAACVRELRTDLARTQPEPPDADGPGRPAPGRADHVPARRARRWSAPARCCCSALSAGQSLGGPLRRTALLRPARAATAAAGRTASRSTRRPPRRASTARRSARAGGSCSTRAAAARRPADPGRAAARCRSTPPRCRSPASRAGPPTTRAGPGCGCAISPRLAGVSRPAERARRVAAAGGRVPARRPVAPGRSRDPRSLLALRVNGADLSLDHGYPARVIVPAAPGVHNTKWVASLTFAGA